MSIFRAARRLRRRCSFHAITPKKASSTGDSTATADTSSHWPVLSVLDSDNVDNRRIRSTLRWRLLLLRERLVAGRFVDAAVGELNVNNTVSQNA